MLLDSMERHGTSPVLPSAAAVSMVCAAIACAAERMASSEAIASETKPSDACAPSPRLGAGKAGSLAAGGAAVEGGRASRAGSTNRDGPPGLRVRGSATTPSRGRSASVFLEAEVPDGMLPNSFDVSFVRLGVTFADSPAPQTGRERLS